MRSRLTNNSYSLLSRNCIAGLIDFSLGQQHRSPTCDVYFPKLDEFVKFANNIEHYRTCKITDNGWIDSVDGASRFPAGLLDDINLQFPHDSTLDDAVTKWNRRFSRFSYDECKVLVWSGPEPICIIGRYLIQLHLVTKCCLELK